MPAGLPGATRAQNAANPSQGTFVIFDLLSGPKGSPFDNDKDYALAVQPFFKMDTTTPAVANGNASTGALATGIGFGGTVLISPFSDPLISNAARGIRNAGFTDNAIPGVSPPDPFAPAGNSTLMYIGGGRCNKNIDGLALPVPYTAGFGIGGAGNAASRDAGAGPAFTGFLMQMVTAAAGVAPGAVIEAGFTNRTGVAMTTDQSTFGSAVAASSVPA